MRGRVYARGGIVAKAQIKPVGGGSFTDMTGKTTSHVTSLPPAQQSLALMAAGAFANASAHGQPTMAAYAQAVAAAQGRLLQWV